jgi:hypothetical protein
MRVLFGAQPPKLFTPMTASEMGRHRHGECWVDPDTGIELRLPREKLRTLIRRTSAKGKWIAIKAIVKYILRDPYLDTTPRACFITHQGFWIHRHDLDHIDVSRLRPIRMGDALVNGIDGIPSKLVPHFHPNDPKHQAQYDGNCDEYRVVIHEHQTNPSPASWVRLRFFQLKMLRTVNPFAATRAHRCSLSSSETL